MFGRMGDPMDPVYSQIIERMKASGVFDQFRKECIADVDTKVMTFWWIMNICMIRGDE